MIRPPFVVRASDVPEHEGSYPAPFDAERLSWGRDLGRAAGSRALGVWEERLPPGRRTSFTHAHQREEELVRVLAGHPTLRWVQPGQPAQEVELAPGDLAVFPAGTGIAHTFTNRSDADAWLLVVGERRNSERAAYPEDPLYAAWREVEHPLRAWTDAFAPDPSARAPAYRVHTARVVLRPWEPSDALAYVALVRANHPHLARFMPWSDPEISVDDALATIRRFRAAFDRDEDHVYGVFDLEGRPIGGTGLHARVGPNATEIGYWIDAAHEGRGFVSELVAALTRLAFRVHGLDRVEIRCEPDNTRSAAVPRRLGFHHETTLARRLTPSFGAMRDAEVWTMFAERFAASPAAAVEITAWDGAGRRLV